jgi:hypothetical protein
MNIFDPTQQAYQRRQLDIIRQGIAAQGLEPNIAAFSQLRQEFIFAAATDIRPVFDFKTPGCGRANPSNQNSQTEVLLSQSSRFMALYLGFSLFRRDDTAATGLASAASIDYTYPHSAVFADAGAATAFTSLEQVYNGTFSIEQNKSKSALAMPMKAFREIPPFISRNQEAAGADVELALQPYNYGQGFIPLVPRLALAGNATNSIEVRVATNNNALFAVVPTAPQVRYGLAATVFGISLDNVDIEALSGWLAASNQ